MLSAIVSIGSIVFLGSIIWLVLCFKKKKPKRNAIITLLVSFILVGVLAPRNDAPDNQDHSSVDKSKTVSSSEKLPEQSSSKALDGGPDSSAQPAASDPVEPTMPDSGEKQESTVEEAARDYLARQFELEVTDFKESANQFEVTVSVDGVSDRDDQAEAPDDWQSIQLRMISAQARLSEELEAPEKETRLYLRDTNNDLMLSIQSGKVTYDKYKEKEKPASSNNNGENFNTHNNPSQQQTTANYVLNTNTMKFHYPSCDSVAKIAPENYSTYTGTRDGAISKGYDPCGKCNP